MMKRETVFRKRKVDPFLLCLPGAFFMSIQQVVIRGTPDKLGLIHGFFVALELKADNKEPSKLQAWFLDQVAKAGGVALAVRPDNWKRVQEILLEIANSGEVPVNLPEWRELL